MNPRIACIALAVLLMGAFGYADYFNELDIPSGELSKFSAIVVDFLGETEYSDIAPVGSILRIESVGEYTIHYAFLGRTAKAMPPLKVVVRKVRDNAIEAEWEKTIYSCGVGLYYSGPVCANKQYCTLCTAGAIPADAFVFMTPGEYEVELYYSTTFKNSDWQKVPGFPKNVVVVGALAAVNGPKKAVFSPGEPASTIVWTVTNHSSENILLQDAVPAGCTVGVANCAIEERLPLKIEPEQSIIITQAIEVTSESTIAFDLSLAITYSEDSENPVIAKTAQSLPVEAEFAKSEVQEFSVKVLGREAGQCTGSGGAAGLTGASALPRIMLSWQWDNIAENQCDSANENYIYCDAVQFGVELSKKLYKLEDMWQNPGNYTSEELSNEVLLKNFRAYLVSDGYSKDFQQDFADYYTTQEFGELNSWFKNLLPEIFASNSSLKFYYKTDPNEPNTVDNQLNLESVAAPVPPGLYDVSIEIDWENALEKKLVLDSGEPNATISVVLVPKQGLSKYNPFYYTPFDGRVGVVGGGTRIGYGTAYHGAEAVKLVGRESDTERVVLGAGQASGSTNLELTLVDDFDSANDFLRGSVLFLHNTGEGAREFELKYIPTTPTPIFTKIAPAQAPASTANAFAYYYLTDNSIAASSRFFSRNPDNWSAQASTLSGCSSFDGTALGKSSVLYSGSVAGCAEKAGVPESSVYGFYWPSIASADDFVYLKTVFFVPDSKQYSLHNYCASGSGGFVSPMVAVPEQGNEIPLNYGGGEVPGTVAEVFGLVRQEKVCVAVDNKAIDFYWNEEKLFEELEEKKLSPGHEALANKCS